MSNEINYKNLIAFHPGSYVEDIIDDLNITQKEFARRLGTTEKSLSKLVNGEDNLSKEMAYKLSKLTGISINTWMNLQNEYEKKILEINDKKVEDEKRICKMIDFKYFKDLGIVENRRYPLKEKIEKLHSILNISDLTYLTEFNMEVSYRNTREFDEKSIINSNVMLEIASNIARNKCDKKLDKQKLRKYLPEIKEMTLQDPSKFYPRLKEILFECGIVLVALPNLRNANINGATKKFRNGSVMLLITDRNKYSDIFWFSIMHEISHILDSDFYTDYKDKSQYIEKELKANKFARDFFINEEDYREFVNRRDFSKNEIVSFSSDLGIHPSILLGRLQKDEIVPYSYLHELKIQYSIEVNSQ